MPSPKDLHQLIVLNLSIALSLFVKTHRLGFVRTAPLDVHLDEENVFQPDLLFISNERRGIIRDWVFGAPDLVVEVLSSGTAAFDRSKKKRQYGKHGVREYWLVSPERKTVEVFVNQENKLKSLHLYSEAETLASPLLPGFEAAVRDFFTE